MYIQSVWKLRNGDNDNMKILIIHGQNHKGSTYHIAHMLAEKIKGDIKEFFLPRDFGEFCVGCTKCFMESEKKCSHYEKLKPLTDAMDEADVSVCGPRGHPVHLCLWHGDVPVEISMLRSLRHFPNHFA